MGWMGIWTTQDAAYFEESHLDNFKRQKSKRARRPARYGQVSTERGVAGWYRRMVSVAAAAVGTVIRFA